ncbi:MAG TPA: Rne/Rng family ribonuclease [Propionibacteriaceae bacterium]|nr:Rne/Rng family ribonuclease [Propionibacteriaceae bacterium]
MLDNEPDTHTQETTKQPQTQPAPRRRRAASRPAGPPSSAPDAPKIERVDEWGEPVSEDSTAAPPEDAPPPEDVPPPEHSRPPEDASAPEYAPPPEDAPPAEDATPPEDAPPPEDATPAEKTAKKTTAKRATKKTGEETPGKSEGSKDRTPRKRATKKTVAAAAEAAATSETQTLPEPEELTPQAEVVPPSDAGAAVEVVKEEASQESAPPAEVFPELAAEELPTVDEATEEEAGEGRRRRRRRGGRRRRRTGGDETGTADVEQAEEQEPAKGDGGTDIDEGPRRRRRRRRRRGEDAITAPDDPTDTILRVREPRQESSTEVAGIDGSTRMEAKRQRRREGRDGGRRRSPVLSEAEFLARRESVMRKMIIRQRDNLAQIAVLEDDILVEHYVDRDSTASLIGNVYLGRVQNVLPSMEAAFVDIGRGRNGVIYAGEIDWDYFGAEGQNRKVEKVLKSGQTILVQVTKDPVGAKGARLTNHVSIPGRYIVYAPGGHLSGISRKLPEIERRRLKEILSELVGDSASVIVRTAAEGASEEELVRDVNRLKAQWEDIERKVATGNAPQLLYAEPDLTVRIVRDLFTEDFSELIISGNGGITDAYDSVEAYVSHVAPHLKDRLRRWEIDRDLFAEYRLDEQIAKALERKVFLPSGGSLIIDRTEAMTVIDVNTGKFTGTGGNLESTVTSNNLEAAEEIVRQLRLRDIGGIIVIDFIDMVLPSNRELLLRRLVECLGRDRTRHQVAEITSLGLVQMTRKRIGTGLLEAFTTECPQCHGRGYELHDVPVPSQRHADGGARESRPREPRANAQAGPEKPMGVTDPADITAVEVASERRPAARSRRGGGRSRSGAANREHDAAEPQDEPAGVS